MATQQAYVDYNRLPRFEPTGLVEGNRNYERRVTGIVGQSNKGTSFVVYPDQEREYIRLSETTVRRLTSYDIETLFAVLGDDVMQYPASEIRRAEHVTVRDRPARTIRTDRGCFWPDIASAFPPTPAEYSTRLIQK